MLIHEPDQCCAGGGVDGGGGARTEQLPLGPKHMEKSTPLEAMKSSTSSVVEPPKWAVDR